MWEGGEFCVLTLVLASVGGDGGGGACCDAPELLFSMPDA